MTNRKDSTDYMNKKYTFTGGTIDTFEDINDTIYTAKFTT